ncbi:MAG: class I SAM-dependent methyltransferase [Solirubrobacteraceae bacterium]
MSDASASSRPAAETALPAHVIWHDLECGGYRVDLALWHELAARAGGPILDIGAGTGRVSLDLAQRGHPVTAVDIDAVLLRSLRARASGRDLEIETVCADARSFDLQRRDFALGMAPMQTVQLLGGSAARVAFLRAARAHLREGATVACAILTDVEPFDCAEGGAGPAAERVQLEGRLYLSRAVRVSELPDGVEIERDRRVIEERAGTRGGDAQPPPERNLIKLDRVDAAELEREAREAGLRAVARHEIAATDEHVGSVVVVLGV